MQTNRDVATKTRGARLEARISAEFDHLSRNPDSLVDFMQQSPLCGQDDLQLDRDASLPREVAF